MEDGLNWRALAVLDEARAEYSNLAVAEHRLESGARVLDFGADHVGTLAGGVLLSRALLAGLAHVTTTLRAVGTIQDWPHIEVITDHPLRACMASQYAGWQVQAGDYFAIGSGPARLLRGREPLLAEYGWTSSESNGILALESAQLPGDDVARRIAEECSIGPQRLTLCVARTASFPGCVQVVARCIEATLHKLHELKFDLRRVLAAAGVAPLPPIADDDLQAVGWTNDAIIFGGSVALWVSGDWDEIASAGQQLCSETSADFGRPFIEIFRAYNRDFYQIDKMLFSPARVTIFGLDTGRTCVVGRVHDALLRHSFGID